MSHAWDAGFADFAARIIPGCGRGFGACRALGFIDDESQTVDAAIVYHNWQPEAGVIEISAGSTRRDWLTRARLLRIFGYPFDELNCRIVVARIGEHNARTRRIWRSLGAVEYLIPALRSPQEAEVISVLTREAWAGSKFKRGKNGKA